MKGSPSFDAPLVVFLGTAAIRTTGFVLTNTTRRKVRAGFSISVSQHFWSCKDFKLKFPDAKNEIIFRMLQTESNVQTETASRDTTLCFLVYS